MANWAAGQTAIFKMDDSTDPGLARIKLLKKDEVLSAAIPWDIWRIEVIEIIKPSSARKLKVGKRMTAGDKHFVADV